MLLERGFIIRKNEPIRVYNSFGCDYIMQQKQYTSWVFEVPTGEEIEISITRELGCMDSTGRLILHNEMTFSDFKSHEDEEQFLKKYDFETETAPIFEIRLKNNEGEEVNWSSDIWYGKLKKEKHPFGNGKVKNFFGVKTAQDCFEIFVFLAWIAEIPNIFIERLRYTLFNHQIDLSESQKLFKFKKVKDRETKIPYEQWAYSDEVYAIFVQKLLEVAQASFEKHLVNFEIDVGDDEKKTFVAIKSVDIYSILLYCMCK